MNIITDHHASEFIDLKGCKGETLDVNEWSGVVSCGGLHDSDDDDSTIDTASSTSVGTDTDTNASETESMKTGDGLKLIEIDDDLDDNGNDDESDKSSVYDADIFDQISNCDIGAINDYDKYDTDDSKAAAKIPEFIFLLTGEHKQDHEYTIEIEFEEEEIDYQNRTKSGTNNDNDDATDACTMATKMLDQSNTNSFDDDEESFPCDDDSQYDDFDFGDDDEEEDISIINDVEEDDSMIIKVRELSSMTESMTSSADEDQVEDQDEDDNDDDNDSCISMIDNLMDQFKLLNLASMTESSSSSVYTTDDDEVEVEANVDDEDNEKDDNDHDDTNTDTDCLSTIDNLMEQFEVDLLELKTDMSLQFGTNINNTEPTSITVPLSIISSALTTATATTATEYTNFYDYTPKTTSIEIIEEDDVYIDTNPIEYDLDKEQHTTIKFQDHHHHHHWQQQQQQQQHNYPTHYTHHPCNYTETIAFHENPITTTIVSDDDDDDVAIYVDIDSISSYDNNNIEQYHTMIECQDDDHRQPQHDHYHPCKRTETIEECDGGALPLPPQRPLTRIMPKRRKSEPLLRRVNEDKADENENNNKILSVKQQRIMDIVNDMKLIHKKHTIEQQPIKFKRQQYICIGQ